MSAVQGWVDTFRAEAQRLPGAKLPWLAGARARAIERFAALGWPTNKLEKWRHTSLALLAQQEFAVPPVDRVDLAAGALAQLRQGAEAGHWLVFIDGQFAPGLSDIGTLPAGACVDSLAGALAQRPERLEAVYGDAEEGESPAALNLALAGDGAYIELARGVAIEAPIHLVFVGGVSKGTQLVRNFIVADDGAQVTVVEHYIGRDDATSFTNTVTRVRAGRDARVTHLKLQQESAQAFHLAALDAVQARGAYFASHSLAFGARLARNDISSRLEGEGGEALLNGLYHVDGKRHVDHYTRLDHNSPRCTSRELYRGILDGTGRGVFTGRIYVAPGAVKTDAEQRSDSLLLSAGAESDARPELEIYNDDVKCAHGSTVGQIDETGLFYLRSRGLDEQHARNLLVYAFAAEVLARIGERSLRRSAEAAIRARIPGGQLLEALA
ncbi:MAG: Fe-S cluster assembly protein SufD [Pseudomonadota bacterium]